MKDDQMFFNTMKIFTPKENEIIELITKAHPLKIIADKKRNSVHTIHSHLRNIRIKTNTHSIPELMVWMRNKSYNE
jgi:DNA-binding NarL/FixJ family response regulator